MAPGGTLFRFAPHFGENVLPHGSHEWLPYSKDEVRLKTVNNNLPHCWGVDCCTMKKPQAGWSAVLYQGWLPLKRLAASLTPWSMMARAAWAALGRETDRAFSSWAEKEDSTQSARS